MVRIVISCLGLTRYSHDYTHVAWTKTRQIVLFLAYIFQSHSPKLII